MVAAKRSLRPGQARGAPAGGPRPETAQLRWGLLHPSGRAAAGLPGSRSRVMVERATLPAGTAQRGDPTGGQTTADPCPPRPGLYSHCHTLLYGSKRHWRKPRFSRAPVHPAIGVTIKNLLPPICWSVAKEKARGKDKGGRESLKKSTGSPKKKKNRSNLWLLKGIIHPKIKTSHRLLTFFPNPYELLSSTEHKRRYFEECLNSTWNVNSPCLFLKWVVLILFLGFNVYLFISIRASQFFIKMS